MKVTQISIGRFHHFHLARQLQKHGYLEAIYTGYPRFKVVNESDIPHHKIKSFPWLHTPFMARSIAGLDRWAWLNKEWAWQSHQTLDRYVAKKINNPTILIALSGSGLYAGQRSQSLGGIHICDRGSSHIKTQRDLLKEEYQRYKVIWPGIDQRTIEKEEAEYQQADWISVPSQFAFNSFVEQGISAEKLLKFPYGAKVKRAYPENEIPINNNRFKVLFVGAASPQKGFIDLLEAFKLFNHPNKHLEIIGSLSPEAKALLIAENHDSISFKGFVPNNKLRVKYSSASVFILPSIQDGFGMVFAEAMACGCPVIATTNTGAPDLVTDGVEGFIVPIRSPQSIADRLQQLADQPELRKKMGRAALARIQELNGWDEYGNMWDAHIQSI